MKTVFKIILMVLLLAFFVSAIIVFVKKTKENNTKDQYIISPVKSIAPLKQKSTPFTRKNLSCNIYLPSKSPGLVLDSIIVCNKTKNLPAKPCFAFEDFDLGESYPNEFIFVNMDTTDFKKLDSEDAPQYVLCKTKQAYNILSENFPKKEITYVGFTSIDRMKDGFQMDYDKFIHICGKSPFKGTIQLIKSWIKNPHFPTLKIVCNNFFGIVSKYKSLIQKGNCINIELLDTFIEEDQVQELYNTYGIHICPSKHEGWGHYIAEAKSCKAVVLYTDAPSMNETFRDGYDGISIPCDNNIEDYSVNGLCPVYNTTVENIQNAVNKLLQITTDKRKEIGNNARNSFLQNDIDFQSRLSNYIKGNNKIEKIIHRIWINKNNPLENDVLPERYNKYITVWKEYNSDFTHKLWSGKQIIELIMEYFPEYVNFYLNLTPFIKKCDFARFVIVYVYGGFYCDIDFYCKRNISYLTEGGENYFIREPKEHYIQKQELLCNGFFGACKNNDFVLGWIDNMVENKDIKDVLRHTGPIAFDKYSKITKNKMLLGNTCDILSVISSFKFSSECDSYNYDISTLWFDGTDWDTKGPKRDTNKIKELLNPIDSSNIIWDINDDSVISNTDSTSIINIFNRAKKINNGGIIIFRAYSGFTSIALAMALRNIGKENIIVYAFEPEKANCDLIEKASMLNFVQNIKIIRNDFLNQQENEEIKNTNYTSWNEFTKNKKLRKMYYTPDSLFIKNQIGTISIIYVNENSASFLNGCKHIISTSKPIIIQ
jgi:mannosyltransferase OCH1-like enzyme